MKAMTHSLVLALSGLLFACNDNGPANGAGNGAGNGAANANAAGAAAQSRASKFLIKAKTYSRDALSAHAAADREGGENGENVSEELRETVEGGQEENYGGNYGDNSGDYGEGEGGYGEGEGGWERPRPEVEVQPARPEVRPLLLD